MVMPSVSDSSRSRLTARRTVVGLARWGGERGFGSSARTAWPGGALADLAWTLLAPTAHRQRDGRQQADAEHALMCTRR